MRKYMTMVGLTRALQRSPFLRDNLIGFDEGGDLYINYKSKNKTRIIFEGYYNSSQACIDICNLLQIEYSQE